MLLAKVDEMGKLAWLAITLIAFWLAWPVGIAVLAFLAGSGRLRAFRNEAAALPGRWSNLRETAARNTGFSGAWFNATPRSSGNQAFDAYREETLRRLEEEQREFQAYLERLRRARDKAEFDQFMAERRHNQGISESEMPDATGSRATPSAPSK